MALKLHPTFAATRHVFGRLATAFAIIAALVSIGCGRQAPPPISGPIDYQTVTADLLERAEGRQGTDRGRSIGHAPRISTSVTIPTEANLELIGAIPKIGGKKAPTGSVEFVVSIDGAEVLSRSFDYKQEAQRLETVVDLAGFAGDAARIELEIRDSLGKKRSSWRRAIVRTTETVERQPAGTGPNLLMIVVDTLRADHCGLYGYPRSTTPFLDRFAEDAIVFDHAVAQSSWTLPSVATLMTGRNPDEHQALAGTESLGFAWETLPEIAQRDGFSTFAVSANPLVAPAKNFDQGFETMKVFTNVPAAEVNAAVFDQLDRVAESRFFGYIHYMDPHTPYDCPAPAGTAFVDTDYDGVFADPKAIDRYSFTVGFGLEPLFPVGSEDLEYLVGRYDGDILSWDRAFENLIGSLEERGLLDNTIVILTSDHGEEFLDHGMVKHGQQLYHETIHVPLLIRAPIPTAGQVRVEVPFELIHLYEGVQHLLGLNGKSHRPPVELAGMTEGTAFSYVMPASQPKKPWPRHRISSLVSDGWKLIRWLDDDRIELYRLDDDPSETVNLADSHPEVVIRLGLALDLRMASASEGPRDHETADAEDLEQLRALGYIE